MSSPEIRGWCGTMPVHRRLLDVDPAYARARTVIEDFTFAYRRSVHPRRAEVLTVPVVVHVIWHTGAEDVDEAQVRSQLDVLNADFRARNPDVSRVPEVWRDLVADVTVDFTLATRDPADAPTDGITRTRADVAAFDTDDAMKFTARGGTDAWPADRYLNLWVCPLGGGLLGYAQFPGGPPETDGVVLTQSAFGTCGTAAAPFDLGRTATHEVGHWLNLRHIWGDDGDGCGGSDLVADTPNQGGPNYGAPVHPKLSCDNGPAGDMFMNYMDYTDDQAMYMFTRGQAERMEACLAGPRAAVTEAAGAR